MLARALFWLGAVGCLLPLVNPPREVLAWVPPGALLLGLAIALAFGNPYAGEAKKVSRPLLQGAVVLLGFSVDLRRILEEGRTGLVMAVLTIAAVFALGALLRRLLKIDGTVSLLVSAGTAICGGSAIAAMASVTKARDEEVSVSLGTVFVLNAIALVLFPPLGHAMGMPPSQFGAWAGIAIHDIASVVGAATAYGGDALETGTVVKLSRVLYLFPVVLIAWAWLRKGEAGKVERPPAFIGLFLLASLINTLVPAVAAATPVVRLIAAAGFALSLYLIGLGVSIRALKAVGPRPLIQGALLWAFISVAGLMAIRGL
jgi:uncharacterized integral membrane protein (TIGR00698 family)